MLGSWKRKFHSSSVPYTTYRSYVGTATTSTNQVTHSANAENHIASLVGSLEIIEYDDIQGTLQVMCLHDWNGDILSFMVWGEHGVS